ncbi:MAG: hypothetical protein Q9172_000899 [Xanthocarpia lactea]
MSTPDSPPQGGHQNKAPMLRAVLSSELAIATIIVALRFFCRIRLTRSPGMDDWIMLATIICAAVGTTVALVGMTYGIGRHFWDLQHDDAVFATKLDWLCQAFVITALTIGKVSVAFYILRLSNTKWHFYFLHTINVTLALINVPLIIWTYTQCSPSAKLWDPNIPGDCHEPKMHGGFAIFQGSTDLLYALFPILIIRPLQMPRKRKIQLASIIGLGTLSAAAGAIKTYYLQLLHHREDFIYEATSLMVWYTTEMYIIIIAGSLPVLRPLFVKSSSVYRSYKQRSFKGDQSYDQPPHELQPYRKNHPDGSTPHRNGGRSSHREVLAADVQGITKTVDFTVAATSGEEDKRWERWEEEYFAERGMHEDERV